MFKIFVHGVCISSAQNFTEFFALYKKAIEKYGIDAVTFERPSSDGIHIHLHIYKEE